MISKEYIDRYFSQVISLLRRIEEKIDNKSLNEQKPAREPSPTRKKIMEDDDLLDNQDVCLFLGISKRTLQRYKQFGKFPYYRGDGISYYKKSEILAFLKKRGIK